MTTYYTACYVRFIEDLAKGKEIYIHIKNIVYSTDLNSIIIVDNLKLN